MKALIRVQNNFSWLATDSDELRKTLYSMLRFRAKGYFHSRLYKQGRWNGYNEFFTNPAGRFLTGLLPEVEAVVKHYKCEYKIKDERTGKPDIIQTEITPDFLMKLNPEVWGKVSKKLGKPLMLEDYQCDLPMKALKHLRGTIEAPTSAGKTYIMMAILACLDPKTPVLIVAGKINPISQAYNELKEWGFKNVGRVWGGVWEPNYITCACVDSVEKLDKVLPKVKVLIADEVHDKMTGDTAKKMYSKLTGCSMRLAVSATPFKHGGTDKTHMYSIKGYYGPRFKTNSTAAVDGILQTHKLQERGRLSYADCHFWPITSPELPHAIYGDAVTYGVAQNWQFHNIVKALVEKKCKGRTLILVERVEHGDALKSLLPDAFWVRGQDNLKTREEVIKQLQSAEGNCIGIATNGIFNAAVNVFIHNLINAGGVIHSAEHSIKQLFGRGLRVAQDKDILEYHDFLFKINEYLEDHSKGRIKILKKEKHKVTVHDEIDFYKPEIIIAG